MFLSSILYRAEPVPLKRSVLPQFALVYLLKPVRILINNAYKYRTRVYGILSLRGEVYRVCANTRMLNLELTFTYVSSHFSVCST